MASSPSKTEQCLFCSMSESMSEDVNWVQCGKCQHWAHFSCAGVDQGVVNSDWRCPQCLPSSAQQLKVPDAAAKKRSKKSGQRSDGGSELGAGSDVDPIEKQLEEEQLAKEKAFAKQMAARKKLLARQKAGKEEQQRQEQEMRELKLQVQREMEEQQLEHEQKLLDAQLAAEQAFVKKREAIRRQFTSSVNRVNALKGQESAVGEASEDHPKKRVKEWLKDQSAAVVKPSTADFRGAYPKGDEQFGAGCSTQVGKPKPMSKVPVITEFEAGTSEDSDSDGDSSSDESFKDVRAESSRRGSLRRSRVVDRPGPRVGRIYEEQLDDRAESSRHSSLRRSRGAEGPGPSTTAQEGNTAALATHQQ
nr:auxilin-related protein 2-like [Aedes albopictus]